MTSNSDNGEMPSESKEYYSTFTSGNQTDLLDYQLLSAPKLKRILAKLVDFTLTCLIIASAVELVVLILNTEFADTILSGSNKYESEGNFFVVVMLLISFISLEFLVQILPDFIFKRSIGKAIFGLTVVRCDGTKPKNKSMFLRLILQTIPFDIPSFFFDKSGIWHDYLTNTLVVKKSDLKDFKMKNNIDGQENLSIAGPDNIGKTTGSTSDAHLPLSSTGSRFLNMFIDSNFGENIFTLVILIPMIIVFALLIQGTSEDHKPNPVLFGLFISFIFIMIPVCKLAYYAIMENSSGRTIGKYITNTKVINLDGSKPNLKTIIQRNSIRLIPFNAFSYIMDSEGAWHDYLVKVKVVDIRKKITN